MGEEYSAKVFKSGNSMALRLPKAMGLTAGDVMRVREDHGSFILEPAEKPKRRFNIAKVWGCAAGSDLRPPTPEEREFEHRPLLWEDPEWMAMHGDPK